MTLKKVAFDDLIPDMKTGDIMLFNGQYGGSKFIELMELSEWSHVGIVVKLDDVAEPLIWEATSLTNVPDSVFHDQKPGVKLVSLRERLEHYGDELEKYKNANFAYRKMNMERKSDLNQKVLALNEAYHGIEDPGFWEMIWDVIRGRIFRKSVALDKFFCSEFVAEMYLKLGWIDDKKPINAYMPSDFSDRGHRHLKLLEGQLSKEVLVEIKHI
jgi:hypothetical protein